MIRLIQRKLIIPRGDTGYFTIPVIATASHVDVAVFTIFDCLTRTKICEDKIAAPSNNSFTFVFSHNDTVNLKPGKYFWDVKFYKNPVYANGKLVNGEEIDSYYAGYALPECEIRETGDDLLVSSDAPSATISPAQLNIISAALAELSAAVTKSETNVTHYPQIREEEWYVWDAVTNDYVATGVAANGIVGPTGNGISSITKTATSGNVDTYTINFTNGTDATFTVTNGESGVYVGTSTPTNPNVNVWIDPSGDPVNLSSIQIHVCTVDEYDAQTGVPTIASPDAKTFYLVPGGETNNLYVEWIYLNNAWEQFGSASIDLSGYATKTDTVLETTLSRGRKAETTVGTGSFAFGSNVEASANYAYAVGTSTIASGSVAHAEGVNTVASASAAHAEGFYNQATGLGSHAEGGAAQPLNKTIAAGAASHSEGRGSVANGIASHAEGYFTVTNGQGSHAGGRYNVEDTYDNWPEWTASTSYEVGDKVKLATIVNNETIITGYICKTANSDASFNNSNWTVDFYKNFAEIIGNGTSSARSNARALDWQGNEYLAGDIYIHANTDSSGGNKVLIAADIPIEADSAIGSVHNKTFSEELNNTIYTYSTVASGIGSFAEGGNTTASGRFAHAENCNTEATGTSSHSEGNATVASGNYSHVEGQNNNASGNFSHAEGRQNDVAAPAAHVEGRSNSVTVSGKYAHAEGQGTIASAQSSHVGGEYNVEDSYDNWDAWAANTEYSVGDKVKMPVSTSSRSYYQGYICKEANNDAEFTPSKWITHVEKMNYAYIIGNGTGTSDRSNAYALGWDGNGYYAGDVYVGTNADSSGGTKLATVTSVSAKADKTDTVLDTTLSRGRKEGTTVGDNSLAFGELVEASGARSVAFGIRTKASGSNAVAEGNYTTAGGLHSHAEGQSSKANGDRSHAEGNGTTAGGGGSHAEGNTTKALMDYQHVQGKFNVADSSTYADIVGNGTADDARSNAFALSWTGDGHYAGDVYVNCNADSSGGSKLAKVSEVNNLKNVIVPADYSTSATYVVGDLCWHEGSMYRCSTAIDVAEAWTAAHWTEIVMPKDVRVNGVSVVANGVADIPMATVINLGVVKSSANEGVIVDASGVLKISTPSLSNYKTLSNTKAIVLNAAHHAVFYALAKAAGADMKDIASTTTGTYPETQKSAISQMLNAPETVSGSTPSITAKPGVRYICGECSTLDITTPASGIVDVIFESGSTPTVLTVIPPTGMIMKWANGFDPTSLEANTVYEVNIMDGIYGVACSWT